MEPPTSTDLIKNTLTITNNTHDNNSHDMIIFDNSKSEDNNSYLNSNSESSPGDKSEIRHRHQHEKKERIAAQVREMKRRQKQSEDWKKFKRSLFMPVTIGIGTVLIGGGMIAIYGYFYSRG